MKLSVDIPAIILAGGFGTRLSHVLEDIPKPMAPIQGRPFLELLLDYLIREGIQRVILATGHRAEVIQTHFGSQYKSLAIEYSHEETALGTGGAIKQAFENYNLNEAFVLNGDTFFPVSLAHQYTFHKKFSADATLAVKYLKEFDRYGTITWNAYNRIEYFHEKVKKEEGWINGGIYLINKCVFSNELSGNFSFETEILEKQVGEQAFYVLPSQAYFVDFGIPEDYKKFQNEWGHTLWETHAKKTIFIDRDGVINRRIPNDYVRSAEQFEFLPGVKEALIELKKHFHHLIVVTNQQGIGKGRMTEADLQHVHDYMKEELSRSQIEFDAVLYCPDLDVDNPPNRKPNVGMAFDVKIYIRDIDWSNCTMIGDSTSDIEFGLRMGMHTILVGKKSSTHLAHVKYPNLQAYARALSTGLVRS